MWVETYKFHLNERGVEKIAIFSLYGVVWARQVTPSGEYKQNTI